MNNYKRNRRILCLTVLFFCLGLSGCSLSIGGLIPGGKEELVFLCDEDREERVSQEAEAVSKEPDVAGTEEPEGASGEDEEPTPDRPAAENGKVDLNSAGMDELMTLNGIGESRAKAIMEYRTKEGPFQGIEEIMLVPGIKEGIFSKIKDQITVH